MTRLADEYIEESMGFDHAGTECEVAEINAPWGHYTVGYVRVPEGHPDFGVDYGSADFPDIYNEACGEVTFTDEIDGDDWWIGFDTDHAWDTDWSIEHAIQTTKKLADAVMARMS